jgi:rubrerythrin
MVKGDGMNTQEWLDKVTSSKEELHHWLERQYIGEVTAAKRIGELAQEAPIKFRAVLAKIAADELQHAMWVFGLLAVRGIDIPKVEDAQAEDRYWKPILGELDTFEKTAAAGHHAEGMRLHRIRALSESDQVDSDIREVFARILPDEEYHEKAFGAMTDQESIDFMRDKHLAGLELLGLEI